MLRLLIAGLCLLLPAVSVYGEEPSENAKLAMDDVNRSFIAAHTVANALDLATGGPIMLLADEQLTLIRNGTETAVDVFPPEYDTFKVFAHMPVAIYLMLGPAGAGALDDKRLDTLRDYRAQLKHLEQNIDQMGVSQPVRERQMSMLAASAEFLDGVIDRRTFTNEELLTYTRRMTPSIKANIAGAAISHLNALHAQVMDWKRDIPPDEWSKLRVGIQGAVLARDGNLAKQYFERLLHLEGEGLRLVYMEGYYPPTPLQTLMATRAVDRGVAIAIFDDPDRMFRDVLADAAAGYIPKLNFE